MGLCLSYKYDILDRYITYIYIYFFLWGLFSGSMSLFLGGSDVSVGTFASQEDMACPKIPNFSPETASSAHVTL